MCVQAVKVTEVPTAGCRRKERVSAQKPGRGASLVIGELRAEDGGRKPKTSA